MSDDSEKFKVQFPASWTSGIAETWKTISGPASGALGALQQRMFLWQINNAAEILERMKNLSIKYGIKVRPVAPKFLIPFLEKAGLESEDAPELRDAWAHLLLSESIQSDALNIAFADVLSKLTAVEASIIAELASRFERDRNKLPYFPEPRAIFEKVVRFSYQSELNKVLERGLDKEWVERACQGIEGIERELKPGESKLFTIKVTKIDVPIKEDKTTFKGVLTAPSSFFNKNSKSVLALLRLGIIEVGSVSIQFASNAECNLEWVQLTEFGVRFCNACGQVDLNDIAFNTPTSRYEY